MEHTPIQKHNIPGIGTVAVKRDDLYSYGGVYGGKVRACEMLVRAAIASRGHVAGLVTASSRHSPQAEIVAHVGRAFGVPVRCHMPTGEHTGEMRNVVAAGGEIVQHKPGHNTVIKARARMDAINLGWLHIPFGMENSEAVSYTAHEAHVTFSFFGTIPPWRRVVVPVGSGITLAGVLRGLAMAGHAVALPVLGVVVGADPMRRLSAFGPFGWENMVRLVRAGVPYDTHVHAEFPFALDPVYEGKCVKFLMPGDLFWVVGRRLGCAS